MKYKIAIIVTWFGILPPYFSAWLKSAENNKTVDFLVFSDQDIKSDSENIIVYKTSLQEEISNYQKKINMDIAIDNAYKFCDCRLFFGLFYEELLKNYDFWGYCDIDLVLGDIRHFVTDEILDDHDRVYQYGHLSLYRNNEFMKNIYNLPGSIYTLKEIFMDKGKTTVEEHYGVNRICIKNNLKWYVKVDFADLQPFLAKRLNMSHQQNNYEHQIFMWKNGKAYQIYEEDGEIVERELVYIHWQKRKPIITCTEQEFKNINEFVITSDRIETKFETKMTKETLDIYNPPISCQQRKQERRKYLTNKAVSFCKSDISTKKILLRQYRYRVIDIMTDGRTYM